MGPFPPQGDIKLGAPLPSTFSARPTLSGYSSYDVNRVFDSFDRDLGSHDVNRLLSYDYRDERGQTRYMSGLGANKSMNWDWTRGMHMTYKSNTIGDGKPDNYYHFVLGHDGQVSPNAEAIGWRNTAFTAMGPSNGRMITGAIGFAMPQSELAARLGLPANANVPQIGAALFVAQYGSAGSVERRGNTAVVKGPQGQVEVTFMHQGNNLALAVINNVRSKNGWWGREYYQPGLIYPSARVLDMIKDQGQNSNDIALIGDFAAHGFYRSANALIAEGTGIGA